MLNLHLFQNFLKPSLVLLMKRKKIDFCSLSLCNDRDNTLSTKDATRESGVFYFHIFVIPVLLMVKHLLFRYLEGTSCLSKPGYDSLRDFGNFHKFFFKISLGIHTRKIHRQSERE